MGANSPEAKHFRVKSWSAFLAAAIFTGALSGTREAIADPNFDAGIQFYKKKDYRKAAAYFSQAINRNPSDANAIYYHGLSAQGLGDSKAATRDYATIVAHFPNSSAGPYAAQALSSLDPSYLRQLQRGSGGRPPGPPGSAPGGGMSNAGGMRGMRSYGGGAGGGGDMAGLPDSSTVIFKNSGGDHPLLLIPCSINGREIEMCFDTGAHGVSIGKNHLAEMGIAPPRGAATGQSAGVGSNSLNETWDMNAVVKCGQISRTLPVSVMENMPTPPLLGQQFFSGFSYEIDNAAHSIRFTKKTSAASGGNFGSGDTVPYERDPQNPNHVIVVAQVNGKPMKMFFDTGAQGVTMTRAQARSIGITIPDDATPEQHVGVSGATEGCSFPISSLRLGPINKMDFRISVINDANMPFPLMGQSFFGDWITRVDSANNRIIFKRGGSGY